MEHLHRTQIYIGQDQFRRLQMEIRKEGVRGVSELIRRAIDAFY
ncbi:MAG: ribbon-helix-helix protein, CopG family [Elusimicrobia bacterium]|nr:ribbon-helix-helix protein, CopG family [Elusimicrobiota bacterium]